MNTTETNPITDLLAGFDDIFEGTVTVWHDDHIFYCDFYKGPQLHLVNVSKRHEDRPKRRLPVEVGEFKRLLAMLGQMERVMAATGADPAVTTDIKNDRSWPSEFHLEADRRYDEFTAFGSGVGIDISGSNGRLRATVTCFATSAAAVHWKLIAGGSKP